MSQSSQGTVNVRFSIGFGNNLFQYIFARLLAEHHGLKLNHPNLSGFGFAKQRNIVNDKLETVKIRQEGYRTGLYNKYFGEECPHTNFDVQGFFEDFTIYENHLEKIRSWFPSVSKIHQNDLIVHVRLQNRLVQLNHHMNFISGEAYAKVLERFDFEQLHIVTDAAKWDYYEKDDVVAIRQDILEGPNPGAEWVSIEDSIAYMKELVDAFKPYNPVVHCTRSGTIDGSGGLRDDFMEAFNLIRSFDQVVLYNSTFSWWAAVLGNAQKVGVFSLWKPGREDENPNLGKTDYNGWFGWGDSSDLLANRHSNANKYNKSWRFRKYRSRWVNRYYKLRRKINAFLK